MNYQLTQTGEQVQDILNQAPTTEETLQAEITRSTNKDDALELAIGNEKTRAEGVESNLQTAIGNEKTRAEGAEANLQTAIGNEKTRAELIEGGLRTDVDGIEAKIPTGASSENKLTTESFVNSSVATNTADFKGTYNSLEALETAVPDANANDYAFVISTDAAGNTLYNRYKYVTGTGWVFEYALNNSSFTAAQWASINSAITAALVAKLTGLPTATELTTQLNAIIDSVATEKSRAEGIESGLRTDVNANATAIGTEKTRAEGVEGNLSTAIGNEKTRAEGAELVLQQNINAEALLRGNADTALQGEIDGINAKIPAAASASNQLADKAFVNSSIATNTATFRGTYDSVAALDEVTADNNDYAFVVATDTAGNTVYNRYKYVEGSGWVFEYALNNSSFTAIQWAAVNSGITAALVTKLTDLPDNTALAAMFTAITSLIPSAATSDNKLVDYAQLVANLATKQNTLTFDNVPVENSNNPVKSGGVYTAIAAVTQAIVGLQSSKQDVLTFDAYPTAGSDNPVKSKGIYEKLSEKQDTLTFDNAPTSGSSNPVKSSGIKSAIDTVAGSVTTLAGRVSTNEADIAALQAAYAALTESDPVVVSPTDTWPVSNPQQNVIYRVVDRVNTPPQYYTDYMWNGTVMVEMAEYDNAIDDVPTAGSNNLVKSGGVYQQIEQLSEKIFADEFINRNMTGADQYIGYLTKSIEGSGTRLRLDQLDYPNGFDSYGFLATKEMEIAYDTIPPFTHYWVCLVKDENLIEQQGSGNYVIWGSAALKYNKNDNNLPTANNPMVVEAGDYVVVCVPHGETPYYTELIKGGSNILNENVLLNDSQKEQLALPSVKVEILSSTSFNVYSKIGNTKNYLKHKYQRFSYSHNYANYGDILCGDVWYSPSVETEGGTPLCQGNDNFIYAINPITGFENEEEYKGGGDHGCEVMEWTKFFLDGELFNPADLTPGTILEGSVFKEIFKTKLYASDITLNSTPNYNTWAKLDNNGNPIVNHIHFLEHTLYGDNKIVQNNRLIAKREGIQFKQIFGAMCASYMSASSKLITDADIDIHLIQYAKNQDNSITVSSGDSLPLITFNESNTSQNKSGYYTGGYCVQYGDNFLIKQAMEIVEGTHKNMRIWLSGTTVSYGQSKVYLSPVVGSDAASKTGLSVDTFNIGDVIEVNNKREISYKND